MGKVETPQIQIDRERLVERIVTDPSERRKFYELYPSVTLYELKHQIASWLIEDGRFDNLPFLVEHFIPPNQIIDPEVQQLKENLAYQLINKGVISPVSKEAQAAEGEILRFVDNDSLLTELREILPIHVMGAVVYALTLPEQVTDEQRTGYRSFTTRALLRPYLNDLAVPRPKGSLSFADILSKIPEKVFTDKEAAVQEIIKNYLVGQALLLFREGEEQGFAHLQDMIASEQSEVKKEFMKAIYQEFKGISNIVIPPQFKDRVDWLDSLKDRNLPFPSFRQKYFLWEFEKGERRKLLNGETGSTKTACAYLAMEKSGAQKILIIGPAKARITWKNEAENIFRPGVRPEVAVVEGVNDFKDPKVREQLREAKYIFISSEFLGRLSFAELPEVAAGRMSLAELRDFIVRERGTDALIIDEAHYFSNKEANSTKALIDLVKNIEAHQDKKSNRIPILALTATPISKSLEDFNIIMALLYPERFCLPGEEKINQQGQTIYSFSDLCFHPKAAFSLLFGEKLMIRWTVEDLFGDEVPSFSYNREIISLPEADYVIYDWLANQTFNNRGEPIGIFPKIMLLTDFLTNPQHAKAELSDCGIVPESLQSKEELINKFISLYEAWQRWREQKPEAIDDELFSADWIAKYGENEFLLHCFFSPELEHGIESLAFDVAKAKPELRFHWKTRTGRILNEWLEAATKEGENLDLDYKKILTRLNNHPIFSASAKLLFLIRKAEGIMDNGIPRKKVFIASPRRREGVTRDLERMPVEVDAWSLYEQLVLLGIIPKEMTAAIDGRLSFSERERAAQIFKKSGSKNILVVASAAAIEESMNWAPEDNEENQAIEEVEVICLGYPWGYDRLKQLAGRFNRPGIGKRKRVKLTVLEAEGTIDQGFFDLIRYKELLTLMVLSGVELSAEDKRFFDRVTSSQRTIFNEISYSRLFLREFFRKMKGAGAEAFTRALNRQHEGKTYARIVAEAYFDGGRDRYKLVGNNAKLVATLLGQLLNTSSASPPRILSVGAGTCLFNRCVNELALTMKVDNYDINPEMMRVAKDVFPQIGRTIVGDAADLRFSAKEIIPDGYYDGVECSFMLDLTQLFEDDKKINQNVADIQRVKVLFEINRVLKPGGIAIITLPDSSFSGDQGTDNKVAFDRFVNCLSSHFGFEVLDFTGISFAQEEQAGKRRRLGWIITLRKVATPNFKDFNPLDLAFTFETDYIISHYRQRRDTSGAAVRRMDYPLFDFDEFSIVDPNTWGVVYNCQTGLKSSRRRILQSPDNLEGTMVPASLPPIGIEPPRRERTLEGGDDDLIPGDETDGQNLVTRYKKQREKGGFSWRLWNSLRRMIETELGVSYEEAELCLAHILKDNDLEPVNWREDREGYIRSRVRKHLEKRR